MSLRSVVGEIPPCFSPLGATQVGFRFDPLQHEVDSVENKIERMIEWLEIYLAEVKELSSRATLCLNVAYYGYVSQMWGFHFDTRILRLLSDLNIEIDVDLYAGGAAVLPWNFDAQAK